MFFLLKRIISIILILTLLPLPTYGNAEQPLLPQDGAAVTYWTNSRFNESVTVTDTVFLQQEAVFTDNAELILDGGQLVVGEDAVFYGGIVLAGDGASLDVLGTVHGDIRVTTADARVQVFGSVDGTLTVDGLAHLRKAEDDVSVEIPQDGYVKTLVLAGVGVADVRGTVDLIDTDPSNKVHLEVMGGTVGTLYARSDAQFNFKNARAGTIYMDCLDRPGNDNIHNVAVWDASHVDKIVVDAGHMIATNGSSVDELYIYGKGHAHLDQGHIKDDGTWLNEYAQLKVSAGKVYQIGRGTVFPTADKLAFTLLRMEISALVAT